MPAGCLRATNACLKKAACHLLVHHWRKLRKVKSTRTGSHLIPCTAEPMKSTARETLRYMAETNAAIRVTSRHWHHQCDDSGSNTPDIESSVCLLNPMFASCHGPMNKPRAKDNVHSKSGVHPVHIKRNKSYGRISAGSACLESTLWFRVEWFVNIVLIIAPQNSHSLRIAKLKGSKSKMAPWDKN